MITRDQAMHLSYGAEVHYTGLHGMCYRNVGPRGGVTERITRCRVTGQCQTWKREPERFRLPVKYGLRESGSIHEANASYWHIAADCPLNAKEEN